MRPLSPGASPRGCCRSRKHSGCRRSRPGCRGGGASCGRCRRRGRPCCREGR